MPIHRRHVLAWFGALALSGCAAPKVPLKPNNVQRIGMLPIKEWPASGSIAPFNASLFTVPKREAYEQPSALGNAIVRGMQARHIAMHANRQTLTGTISGFNLFPRQLLIQSLSRQIEARLLPISYLDDYALAEAVRNRAASSFPQDVQALLDIQINEAGYYESGRAGGFTPYFDISSTLWDTVNPGTIIDEFSYSGDFRDAGKDSRFLTTPQDLLSSNLETFRSNPEKFRSGMILVFDKITSMLLDDIHRILNKQPRLK